MATLLITSEGFERRVLKLRLGVNRLGRSHTNDFQIDHPTISSTHCEIQVAGNALKIRDCDSTNGTFVDGERITTGELSEGGSLRLGDVELFAESTDFEVAIPRFQFPITASPPVILTDGSLVCPRHPRTRSAYQCLHCREIMCEGCIKRLRRRGGKVHLLCCKCSHHCESISEPKKARNSLFDFLRKTIKLPFNRSRREMQPASWS